jgi:uncharacterized protein (TIGR02757 family)
MADLRAGLDALYRKYNRRAFVHPDPLELVYRYHSLADQEIAGLVAACLAYGRVAQILASVTCVLDALGKDMHSSPQAFLGRATDQELRQIFRGFKHRFTPGAEVAALLLGMKRALAEHGSLEALFAAGIGQKDETILPALAVFVERLRASAGGTRACPSLLSSPEDGSACKRLNLFLRWMVRRDKVDPGPWRSVSPSKLVVPLDTHLFRIARALRLTVRRQADLKTAMEITRGFAHYSPRDPVRYDFCLTRLGINPACRDDDILRLLKEDP